jgi:hypothetical protein
MLQGVSPELVSSLFPTIPSDHSALGSRPCYITPSAIPRTVSKSTIRSQCLQPQHLAHSIACGQAIHLMYFLRHAPSCHPILVNPNLSLPLSLPRRAWCNLPPTGSEHNRDPLLSLPTPLILRNRSSSKIEPRRVNKGKGQRKTSTRKCLRM